MALPFALDGRVAVVTGAAGLLGRQHVAALARAGAHVVVTDLDEGPCRDLAHAITREHGREALACAADVTDRESLRGLADAALARFGRIDVLVNNAALNERVEDGKASFPFEYYPLELWDRALRVNVTGA